MHEKNIAQQVVDGGGDYVLTVKDNQPGLLDDIHDSFVTAQEVNFEGFAHDTFQTEDKGHGRSEKRTYTVLYDLADQTRWFNHACDPNTEVRSTWDHDADLMRAWWVALRDIPVAECIPRIMEALDSETSVTASAQPVMSTPWRTRSRIPSP